LTWWGSLVRVQSRLPTLREESSRRTLRRLESVRWQALAEADVASQRKRYTSRIRRRPSSAEPLAPTAFRHFPGAWTFSFLDIASIDPGTDFALKRGRSDCAAVLVVIGPRWLAVSVDKGGDASTSRTTGCGRRSRRACGGPEFACCRSSSTAAPCRTRRTCRRTSAGDPPAGVDVDEPPPVERRRTACRTAQYAAGSGRAARRSAARPSARGRRDWMAFTRTSGALVALRRGARRRRRRRAHVSCRCTARPWQVSMQRGQQQQELARRSSEQTLSTLKSIRRCKASMSAGASDCPSTIYAVAWATRCGLLAAP
jgi:hypothetical protein